VAEAKPLAKLYGAIHAAEEFGRWARAAEFDHVRVVTDRYGPVDTNIVRAAFDEVLDTGEEIDHVIVFFAGHGVAPGAEDQQLLLSRWRELDTEAIKLSAFQRLLGFYQPARVTFILDACRSATRSDETLLGSGVLRRPSGLEPREYEEDRLHAVKFNSKAYMLNRDNPRCLFSCVVLHALSGQEPAAVVERGKERFIASRELAQAVRDLMAEAARRHRITQTPTLKPGFLTNDIYVRLPVDFRAEPLPDPVEPVVTHDLSPYENRAYAGRYVVPIDPTPAIGSGATFRPDSSEPSRPKRAAPAVSFRRLPAVLSSGPGVTFEGPVNVGPPVVSPSFTVSRAPSETLDRWDVASSPTDASSLTLAASLIAPTDRGFWVGAAAYPDMVGTFALGDTGAVGLIYRDADQFSENYDEVAEELLSQLLNRKLKANQAIRYARRLVSFGGPDPAAAAVLAYLFDAEGRTEHIRALAHMFADQGRPVPFDVALLANLQGERDRGGQIRVTLPELHDNAAAKAFLGPSSISGPVQGVPVAGGFPWLRQGWGLLEATTLPFQPQLAAFRTDLTPAPFTTLRQQGGLRLASLIRQGEA